MISYCQNDIGNGTSLVLLKFSYIIPKYFRCCIVIGTAIKIKVQNSYLHSELLLY